MGKFDKRSLEVQLSFFQSMIEGFDCLLTWQGYIYYVIGLGHYLMLRYPLVVNDVYCTGADCVGKTTGVDCLKLICLLRNNLVHFKPLSAINNINLIVASLPDVSTGDEFVDNALDVLRNSDFSILLEHVNKFNTEEM